MSSPRNGSHEQTAGLVLTDRLRLEPIREHHAEDLWTLHQDPGIAEWYGGTWSRETATRRAAQFARGWDIDGVHKWMAYDRETGRLVGRGGLSRSEVDGEIRLELGWALLRALWGKGYATEIGRAGIEFAFSKLGDDEVVAFTEKHNHRSVAVMQRLGMIFVREFVSWGLVEGREGVHNDAPFVLYTIQRER